MKQRITTGIVLAVVFLGLLQWGGVPFIVLMMALAAVGLFEFLRMHGYRIGNAAGAAGVVAVLFIIFPWQRLEDVRPPALEAIVWIMLLLLLSVTVLSRNRIEIRQIAVVAVGVLYIGFGFRSMAYIRLEEGLWLAYFIFTCTWASDIGAYFAGRAFGKRPLLPAISPKKTVEGSIGGVLSSVALAIGFALMSPLTISAGEAALFGLVIAVTGQWGDLIQSAYKRVNNVKDSGSIFPGHGGVLDRCDSWLIVFPFVHMLMLS